MLLASLGSFWLTEGLCRIIAAVTGSSRPTRQPEIVFGVLGLTVGAEMTSHDALYIVGGIWLIILGISIIAGFIWPSRHRGVRAPVISTSRRAQ
jgi:uncharacterized membrane protein HdeD (DUF308 family)